MGPIGLMGPMKRRDRKIGHFYFALTFSAISLSSQSDNVLFVQSKNVLFLGDATLLLFQGGRRGGRGHYHGATEGVEAASRDPQGDRKNTYPEGCSGDRLVDGKADPPHRGPDTGRRRRWDTP